MAAKDGQDVVNTQRVSQYTSQDRAASYPPEVNNVVKRRRGAKHPQFASTETRLLTFRDWPYAMPQRPKELAEAGFFYLGMKKHFSHLTALLKENLLRLRNMLNTHVVL